MSLVYLQGSYQSLSFDDVRSRLTGPGVFETLRYKSGQIEFLKEHLRRWQRGQKLLGVDLPMQHVEDIEHIIEELLERNKLQGQVCRVWIGATSEGFGLTAEVYQSLSRDLYRTGVCLTHAPHPNPLPMAQLKCFDRPGYTELFLAAERMRCDECLCHYQGRVLECSRSNVLVFHQGKYMIPRRDDFRLPGIMEQAVLNALDREVVEMSICWPLPSDANIYITGSLRGLMPVRQVGIQSFFVDIHDPLYQLVPRFSSYVGSE